MKKDFIKALDVDKTYKVGEIEIEALKKMSFSIDEGELVVIVGPSGAGKTTLLNLLGGMDTLTRGSLIVDDKDLRDLNSRKLTLYRRTDVGFVFQFYNLMPNLTALENIELAIEVTKDALDAKEMLHKVGLKDRMHNFPSQLSGGEQQRVSIARALAKNPKLVLCDEPTGALDYVTGKSILGLLSDVARVDHKTVVIVTHNSALKDMADKVIYVKNGTVEHMVKNDRPLDISEIEW
ncbi:ABC transporter ATP-binding protein [Acholeplasma hippikon]|uniref:ABC transporter ATP-binding protein n=1 Tax=Acholeplasma hippikon TaxID=264636 RepID=A0A449BI36_9MOLU|nr:ABC transporter ATP-binding protein [Acholeplasma hippikon]VEU82116.1 ABC transporter ATP-binding protein [Acholeplasma hippikon]